MRWALGVLLAVLLTAPAEGASVAYIKDGSIWLEALDGSQRKQLAPPPSDDYKWREVVQADGGRVLGVARPDGKVATINRTTLWEPDGSVAFAVGSLPQRDGWQLPAYPLGLDLTPNGVFVVYGFSSSSCCTNGQYTFGRGTYLNYADQTPLAQPLKIDGVEWPSLAGDRIVARRQQGVVSLQQNLDSAPVSSAAEFDDWLTIDLSGGTFAGFDQQRTDVAATGTVSAVELVKFGQGSTVDDSAILAVRTASLGGDYVDDCRLPTQGRARDVTLAQDGTRLAWQDDRGVVVGSVPNLRPGGPGACDMPAPVVLEAGAVSPSIGPASAAPPSLPPAGGGTAPPPPPSPGGGATTPPPSGGGTTTTPPGGGTTTTPTTPSGSGGTGATTPAPPSGTGSTATPARLTAALPSGVRVTALRSGLTVTLRVPAAGKVSAVARVGRSVVARGSARAARAGALSLRLRAVAGQRKRLGRLRGRTMVVTITLGSRRIEVKRKLR